MVSRTLRTEKNTSCCTIVQYRSISIRRSGTIFVLYYIITLCKRYNLFFSNGSIIIIVIILARTVFHHTRAIR
jgi:hypothetical protein